LQGLSVAVRKSDGTLATGYPLPDISLPPDDYALLTSDAEGVTGYYPVSRPENIYTVKLPLLANTLSTLVLFRRDDKTVIDELSYSSQWHAPSVKENKGVALERIDPDAATQDAANWTSAAASAAYGTPGYRNSQYKAKGPATGIDKPQYSQETGLYTIPYLLDQPGYNCRAFIYDLSGRRVAGISNNGLTGVKGAFTWDGTGLDGSKLSAGPYILYMELYHNSGKVKKFKEVFLVY
jgi:hypothetical protein